MLFLLAVFLVVVGFPIWGIVDALRQPPSAWTGTSRGLWILIQIVLGPLGTTAYVVLVRNKQSALLR